MKPYYDDIDEETGEEIDFPEGDENDCNCEEEE